MGDYQSYRQALGISFGSVTGKVSQLKDKIYSENISPFVSQDTFTKLGITEKLDQLSDLKNTVESTGGTLSGVLETAGSVLGMRKLTAAVKSKNPLKNLTNDDVTETSAEPASEAAGPSDSGFEFNADSLARQDNIVNTPDVQQSTVNIPETELGETGEQPTTFDRFTEIPGSEDQGIEMSNLGEQTVADTSEIGTDVGAAAGETAAEITAEVTATETVAATLDAIPFLDIAGAVLGVGAAIFGAVEGATSNNLESQENQADMKLANEKQAVSQGLSNLQFKGDAVIPNFSSTGQMPSNSGTF